MPMTKEEVAEAVREWCEAWDTRDIPAIIAMEGQAGGFGYRALARRDHAALGEGTYWQQRIEEFFDRMEYFHCKLEDLQTSVTGDTGVAWGLLIEEFQEKGRPPERARIRLSLVLTKGARGWQVLLYHRDTQSFNDDGSYPRALTVVSPAA